MRSDVPFVVALVVIASAVYLPNVNDYFLGDDFDLIKSVYDKPASYFARLLYSNEAGDAWVDPTSPDWVPHGYLRPIKIWWLKLDLTLWGTESVGYHLTSTLIFAGNVVLVFLIMRAVLPHSRWTAFLAGATTAIHPVFSEVVPFITAREETQATLFVLWSFLAFLSYRRRGRRPWAFHLLYGAALLTKESAVCAIALVLGYDLVNGHLIGRSRDTLKRLVGVYLPVAGMLIVYLFLRWLAFGNIKGGEPGTTDFSLAALVDFHLRFYGSIFDRTMFLAGKVPAMPLLGALLALAALAYVWVKRERLSRQESLDLLFFGPVWYTGATVLLYGTYFSPRHNILPTVGLVFFFTLVLQGLLRARARRQDIPVLATFAVLAALLLPPTLETSLEYDQASRTVSKIRDEIAAGTAALPPGSIIRLKNVPQWGVAPWYFGWGLLSALKKPFTESDLSNRSTVVDLQNIRMLEREVEIPLRYDLVIKFREDLVPPYFHERRRLRVRRDER